MQRSRQAGGDPLLILCFGGLSELGEDVPGQPWLIATNRVSNHWIYSLRAYVLSGMFIEHQSLRQLGSRR